MNPAVRFGSAYVSREWAIKNGVVDMPRKWRKRLNRLIVSAKLRSDKGCEGSWENSTDIVISNDDAASVRSAAANLKFSRMSFFVID